MDAGPEVIATVEEKERRELRRWAGRKMGWALQPHQFGCIPGNVRMSWVSIKNGELHREYLEEDWRPDDPHTGQIWMVAEEMKEKGWRLELFQFDDYYEANWYKEIGGGAAKEFQAKDPDPALAIIKAARATAAHLEEAAGRL